MRIAAACALALSLGCANTVLVERYAGGQLVERRIEQRCFARVCDALVTETPVARENGEIAMVRQYQVRLQAKRESGWAGVLAGAIAGWLSAWAL